MNKKLTGVVVLKFVIAGGAAGWGALVRMR